MSDVSWIVVAYVTAALLDAAGIMLVVLDVRDATRALRELRETSEIVSSDLRYQLDHIKARYGVTMAELAAAARAARVGLGSVRRRVTAVCLLLAGVVVGAGANIAAATR